ncbi:MAG: hypothetical protein HY698_03950 [Deltaproteobacteria bacterium]|nr:hypothetical protein [Deltaproteobacteria bacterium]
MKRPYTLSLAIILAFVASTAAAEEAEIPWCYQAVGVVPPPASHHARTREFQRAYETALMTYGVNLQRCRQIAAEAQEADRQTGEPILARARQCLKAKDVWTKEVKANCPRLVALKSKWAAVSSEIEAYAVRTPKGICAELQSKLEAYQKDFRERCLSNTKSTSVELSTCLANTFANTTSVSVEKDPTLRSALYFTRTCPDQARLARDLRQEDDAAVAERMRREREAKQEENLRRYEREQRARTLAGQDPLFQKATSAEYLCKDYGNYVIVLDAEAQMRRVDEASGTVDLNKRRSYAETKLMIEARIKKSESDYQKAGGRLPQGPPASQKEFWCSQPSSTSIVSGYLKELESKEAK